MAEDISQEKEKPGMHGCLKGCLIFIAVCMVTFVVVGGVVYYKRDTIKGWFVDRTFAVLEGAVLQELPEDVDKEKVRETLGELKTVITEGKVSEKQLKEIMREFEKMMADQKLDADEINALLVVIKETLKEPVPVETD